MIFDAEDGISGAFMMDSRARSGLGLHDLRVPSFRAASRGTGLMPSSTDLGSPIAGEVIVAIGRGQG